MSVIGRIDQLRGDPHPIARLADAPLEHVANAERLADLAHTSVLALEGERGIAGDDEELRQLRQSGDDVFRDPVSEIVLLRIAAHILEGQDRD